MSPAIQDLMVHFCAPPFPNSETSLLMIVLGWVSQTQSLRGGFLCKLFTDEYSQKKESEGDGIGPGKKPREDVETVSAEPTGALECGLCHRGVPTLRQGGQHLCRCVSSAIARVLARRLHFALWQFCREGGVCELLAASNPPQLEISAPAQERRSEQSLHSIHDSQVLSPPLCLPSSPLAQHVTINALGMPSQPLPSYMTSSKLHSLCFTCKMNRHTSCRVILKITLGDPREVPALSAFIKCQAPTPSHQRPPASLSPQRRWQLRTDAR